MKPLNNEELYFVPAVILPGLISKKWKDLTEEEKRIALPVNNYYRYHY